MTTEWEVEDFSDADREEYVKATIERLQVLAAWPSLKPTREGLAAFDSYRRTLWQLVTRMDEALLVEAVERTELQTLALVLSKLASHAFDLDEMERAKDEAEAMLGRGG
jgi:hypothetical protein